jgi:hypothetical protein
LPLFFGWLCFQGPLLALATQKGYLRTLLQRLPHTWVIANLGIAGIEALSLPLINLSVRTCSVLPLSLWTVMTWWAIVTLSAVVGGLLLSAYEYWAVRRGFCAWNVLAWGEGEVVSPPWRKLWWGIPLSYVAVVGGIAVGALILQSL